MIKKFCYSIVFLILLGWTLGCQKSSTKNKSQQVLRINFYSPLSSFHPHFSCDLRTHTICRALYEGLTRINLDGKPTLAMAKKVEISSCKKIYTFILKNSKWSNGEKIISNHFVKAWKNALSPRCVLAKRLFLIKNAKKYYEGKASFNKVGIYAPSDDKVIVELEHPAPYFLQLVAHPLYSPVYDPDLDREQTVFNGPFILKDYRMNESLKLVANPQYWDNDSVRLKEVQISFVKNPHTAFAMYEKGEFDWIGDPFSPIPIELIDSISNIKIKTASSPFWIFCNTPNSKLKSKKIRKALSQAICKKEIIKSVLIHQKEIFGVLPNEASTLKFDNVIEGDRIAKAKELFKEGLEEIGIQKKDFELTLNHSNNSDYERLALYLKYRWEEAFGIRVNLKKDEWNTFYSKIRSGNYEMGGFHVISMYDDPFYFMSSFEYSYNNLAKWEDQKYQRYFTLAKNSVDEEERKRYLRKAEEILVDSMPVIPICSRGYAYTCKDNLKNFSPPTFAYSDFKWVYFDD